MMDVVAGMAMLPMAMMVDVAFCIELRQGNDYFVNKMEHYRPGLLQAAQWPTKTDCWLSS